jgi:23S rRNA (guanosine2251-2'-O)-methyltransferase
MRRRGGAGGGGGGGRFGRGAVRLYGRHAVLAALANPGRALLRLRATREALAGLALPPGLPVELAGAVDLARLMSDGAPHQGLVLEAEPLEGAHLDELLRAPGSGPLVVLDGVTDPHNVGAILRSALAFGAVGLVTQDRHAPGETGALARAAAGALETLPWARVVNLSRALDQAAEAGFWRIGLAGEARTTLAEALAGAGRVALVLGAEGEGLRPGVAQHCDELAKLPIDARMESLNVSVAAGIALYAAAMRSPGRLPGA